VQRIPHNPPQTPTSAEPTRGGLPSQQGATSALSAMLAFLTVIGRLVSMRHAMATCSARGRGDSAQNLPLNCPACPSRSFTEHPFQYSACIVRFSHLHLCTYCSMQIRFSFWTNISAARAQIWRLTRSLRPRGRIGAGTLADDLEPCFSQLPPMCPVYWFKQTSNFIDASKEITVFNHKDGICGCISRVHHVKPGRVRPCCESDVP
jgi:hypothetical protein